MPELQNEKNAYWCDACRGYIVTVNRDDGTTPSGLACRVLGEPGDDANTCKGRMVSMWYPPEPWPPTDGYGNEIPSEPTHEWYRPNAAELKALRKKARSDEREAGTLDYVSQGGLLLRRIER